MKESFQKKIIKSFMTGTQKNGKAEEAVRSIDQQVSEVLESKSDKYHWLDYFAEHQNIQELTRTVAVELI